VKGRQAFDLDEAFNAMRAEGFTSFAQIKEHARCAADVLLTMSEARISWSGMASSLGPVRDRLCSKQ